MNPRCHQRRSPSVRRGAVRAASAGDDRHGEEERAEEGEDHAHGDRADELARSARHEDDREERQNGRDRRAEEGDSEIAHARRHGGCSWLPALEARAGLIDHDDRVVDEETESDDEPGDRHLVNRDPEESHPGEDEQGRERQRRADEKGGAPSHGEHDDADHRDHREKEAAQQARQTVLGVRALVEDDVQPDALREIRTKLLDQRSGRRGPPVDAEPGLHARGPR